MTLNVFIARTREGELYVATTAYDTEEEVRAWLGHESDETLVWFKAFGSSPTPENASGDDELRESVAAGLAGFCTMTDFAVGFESILTELVLAAEAEGRRTATAQPASVPSS